MLRLSYAGSIFIKCQVSAHYLRNVYISVFALAAVEDASIEQTCVRVGVAIANKRKTKLMLGGL